MEDSGFECRHFDCRACGSNHSEWDGLWKVPSTVRSQKLCVSSHSMGSVSLNQWVSVWLMSNWEDKWTNIVWKGRQIAEGRTPPPMGGQEGEELVAVRWMVVVSILFIRYTRYVGTSVQNQPIQGAWWGVGGHTWLPMSLWLSFRRQHLPFFCFIHHHYRQPTILTPKAQPGGGE